MPREHSARRAIPRLLLIALLVLAPPAWATNLVPNGSFECGTGNAECWNLGGIDDWQNVCHLTHWMGEAPGDADLACCSSINPANECEQLHAVPIQAPHLGQRYACVVAEHSKRSFTGSMRVPLNTPLQPGQQYVVSFWAATRNPFLGWTGFAGRGSADIAFSPNPIDCNLQKSNLWAAAPCLTCNCGVDNCGTRLPRILIEGKMRKWHQFAKTFTVTGGQAWSDMALSPDPHAYDVCFDAVNVVAVGQRPTFAGCNPCVPPIVSFSLPLILDEGLPVILGGGGNGEETAHTVEICRSGEDCDVPQYGFVFEQSGPLKPFEDLSGEVAASEFAFHGSPAGIDYDVTVHIRNACGSDSLTKTIRIFRPLEEACDEILDFEGLPGGSGEVVVGASWTEGDYVFTHGPAVGPLGTFASDSPFWSGSKALHDTAIFAGTPNVIMARSDGGPFSVCSVDFAEGFFGQIGHTLNGYADAGTILQVTQPVVLDGVFFDPETVDLVGFDEIRRLESVGPPQWDNVCVCDVERTCTAPPPDMVLWWDSCSATDNSGSGLSGTIQGELACFPTTKVGPRSLGFTGDNWWTVADDPRLAVGLGEVSVDAWVLTETSGFQVLVDKQLSYTLAITATGAPRFSVCEPGTPNTCYLVDATTPVDDGAFHLVAGTLDRGGAGSATLAIYVDGVLEGTTPIPSLGDIEIAGELTVGRGSGVAFPFEGILDELEIFTRALGPAEIARIFAAGSAGKCQAKDVLYVEGTGTGGGNMVISVLDGEIRIPTPAGEVASAMAAEIATVLNTLYADTVVATNVGDRIDVSGAGHVIRGGYSTDPGVTLRSSEETAEGPTIVYAGGPGGLWELRPDSDAVTQLESFPVGGICSSRTDADTLYVQNGSSLASYSLGTGGAPVTIGAALPAGVTSLSEGQGTSLYAASGADLHEVDSATSGSIFLGSGGEGYAGDLARNPTTGALYGSLVGRTLASVSAGDGAQTPIGPFFDLVPGEILWGPASETLDSTDVSTDGALIEAFNAERDDVGSPASYSVNGVVFSNTVDMLANTNLPLALDAFSTGDADMDDLLRYIDFHTIVPSTDLTVGNQLGATAGDLVPGEIYQIQVFHTDLRACCSARETDYGDGLGNTVTLDSSGSGGAPDTFGQNVIGFFRAAGTTQTLSITPLNFNVPVITAYQVRLLEVDHIDGLAFSADGRLWGSSADDLYEIDPATGAAELVFSHGLAPTDLASRPVPEPAKHLLLWAGVAALLVLGRYRAQSRSYRSTS